MTTSIQILEVNATFKYDFNKFWKELLVFILLKMLSINYFNK
jgi:hypothetical protein